MGCDFFDLIWGDAPGSRVIWTKPEGSKASTCAWFDSNDAAQEYVDGLGRVHVYYGKSTQDPRRAQELAGKTDLRRVRGSALSTVAMGAFHIDIDVCGPGHKNDNLPPDIEAARQVIECTPFPKPSLIVETGGGLHAYWILREPHVFADDDDRRRIEELGKRIEARYRQTLEEMGWPHLDSTSDLARVLRVPGSQNWKTDPPVAVVAGEDTGDRYSVEGLLSWLPEPELTLSVPLDHSEALTGVPEGSRNNSVFRFACSLRTRGVPWHKAEAMVLEAAANCSPPLPRDEAMTCLFQAWKYPEGTPMEAFAVITAPGEDTPQQGSTWDAQNLLAVMDANPDEEKPSVLERMDGKFLFYRGRVNTLSGEPESLKSWICLHAAVKELEKGETVLYLDYEDSPRGISSRLLAMGVDKQVIGKRFLYVQPQEPIQMAGERLDAVLSRRPSLVILDGVTEAMTIEGLDINSNGDVATFYHRIPRRCAASWAAVVMIDHVTKSKEGRGRFAIGAQAKLAGLNGAGYSIEMKEPFGRGKTGKAKLWVSKDRQGWVEFEMVKGQRLVAEVIAVSDGQNVSLALHAPTSADAFRPTFYMEKVSKYLEMQFEPANKNAIAKAIEGRREIVFQALDCLVDEDYVTAAAGPRNSVLYTSTNEYRESEDLISSDSRHGASDRFPTGSPYRGGTSGNQSDRVARDNGNQSGTSGNQSEEEEENVLWLDR